MGGGVEIGVGVVGGLSKKGKKDHLVLDEGGS